MFKLRVLITNISIQQTINNNGMNGGNNSTSVNLIKTELDFIRQSLYARQDNIMADLKVLKSNFEYQIKGVRGKVGDFNREGEERGML